LRHQKAMIKKQPITARSCGEGQRSPTSSGNILGRITALKNFIMEMDF
jgi:hypothetical protein